MGIVTLFAPAKINLYLRVFPLTADGFHPLRSWFRTIGLADELAVELGEGCSLVCNDPTVPTGADNLICRAHAAIAGTKGARYRLTKRIPMGGGLGGGSSDGAAALALIRRVGIGNATRDELTAIATALGSDVPFFLAHQLRQITDATCTGRGEVVEPFTPGRRHAVLLILPGLHVATPAVFKAFDALPPPPEDGSPDFAAWSQLSAMDLLPRLRNDLEPAAFTLHPELATLRRDCEARLGRPVRMTGSGSTLFTLYDDPAEAAGVALDVRTVVA